MKPRILPAIYYACIFVLLIGSFFRIQHWVGGAALMVPGKVLAGIFFILVFIEIISSQKASRLQKASWAFIYLFTAPVVLLLAVIPSIVGFIILGGIYAFIGRRFFIHNKKDLVRIQFDSI